MQTPSEMPQRDGRTAPVTGLRDRAADASAAVPMRRTLRAPIGCTGVGLHSGARISLRFLPAAPASGIVFRRTDLPGGPVEIPARWDHVVDTRLNTTLGIPGRRDAVIGTVEHVLAALAGMAVDDAVVELDGPEAPVMDGSAAPFVFLIECAGLVATGEPRQVIEVLRPVRVQESRAGESRPGESGAGEGDAFVALLPAASAGPVIEAEIDFPAAAVRRQMRSLRLTPASFKADLAAARTFGFVEDVEALRAAGLARGGSLKNAVVVAGARVLNEGGLRFADEFVRHKMLDIVGDLGLAGLPLAARVVARRPGHRLNNQVLRALFADPAAFRIVPATGIGVAKRAGAGGIASAAAAPA